MMITYIVFRGNVGQLDAELTAVSFDKDDYQLATDDQVSELLTLVTDSKFDLVKVYSVDEGDMCRIFTLNRST